MGVILLLLCLVACSGGDTYEEELIDNTSFLLYPLEIFGDDYEALYEMSGLTDKDKVLESVHVEQKIDFSALGLPSDGLSIINYSIEKIDDASTDDISADEGSASYSVNRYSNYAYHFSVE